MFSRKTVCKLSTTPMLIGVGINVALISSSKALATDLHVEDEMQKAKHILFLKARDEQLENIQQDLNDNIVVKVNENKLKFELKDVKRTISGHICGKSEHSLPDKFNNLNPNDLEFKLTKDDDSVLGISKVELVNKNTKETVLNLKKSFLVNSLECIKILLKAYFLDINMNTEVYSNKDGNTCAEKVNSKFCNTERVKDYLNFIGKPVLDWHCDNSSSAEVGWCDRITVPDGEGGTWPVILVSSDKKSKYQGVELNAYQLSEVRKNAHDFVWKEMDYNKALYSCSIVFKDGSCKLLQHTPGQDVFGCINFAAYFMYFLDNC